MNERMATLLKEAAKCFEQASSPFTTEWLAENHVRSDECIDLSDYIATAIKFWVSLPNDERVVFALKQAVNESELDPEVKKHMLTMINYRDVVNRLKKK